MLAVALDLRIDLGKVTDLAWQRETLLEILIRVFCDKLTAALRKGMPRRYVGHDDDLPTLRGTLDITRQFTRRAVDRSEEHTSELQSLMRISYAVFCLKKKQT